MKLSKKGWKYQTPPGPKKFKNVEVGDLIRWQRLLYCRTETGVVVAVRDGWVDKDDKWITVTWQDGKTYTMPMPRKSDTYKRVIKGRKNAY